MPHKRAQRIHSRLAIPVPGTHQFALVLGMISTRPNISSLPVLAFEGIQQNRMDAIVS